MILPMALDDNSFMAWQGPKSGPVISILDSQLEGSEFEYRPILDGNSTKAMPGSIPAPNSGSFNMSKEGKWGTAKKHQKKTPLWSKVEILVVTCSCIYLRGVQDDLKSGNFTCSRSLSPKESSISA
jgi:hypothetical protein